MCSIPTTVLWPSRILELVVLLCSVQLPTYPAVILDQHQELIGTFLMKVGLKVLILYHTTEHGQVPSSFLLEQYSSTVTLELPQQESFAVRYVMPMEILKASMWEYMVPSQVSPVYWREMLLHMLMLHDVIVDLAWVSSITYCDMQRAAKAIDTEAHKCQHSHFSSTLFDCGYFHCALPFITITPQFYPCMS